MNRYVVTLLLGLILAIPVSKAGAADSWPRSFSDEGATITIYQPQVERFESNELTARAAIAVEQSGSDPIFGAFWFKARTDTDREERIIRLRETWVLRSRFPDAGTDQADRLHQLITDRAPGWDLDLSLDAVIAMIEYESSRVEVEDLNNDPPRILIRTHPALLVLIEGEPKLQPVDGSEVMRVINSPMYILFDTSLKQFYLKIGDEWFASGRIDSGWRDIPQPPTEVLEVASREDFPPVPPEIQRSLDAQPEIVVSLEPAELIVTDGKPEYSMLEGTSLLYMTNSGSDVFLDIDSQMHYVVLSGRWFKAKTMQGTWQYVAADRLPAGFANIDPESIKGSVLSHVPGTRQAEEAILDASIPQTAEIERDRSLDVIYDGTPEFVRVTGTPMAYAVNTPYAVLRVDGSYYACNDAVWFVSISPYGPWRVATWIPSVIYTLPPENPIYYVRYVYIYGYTPEIVYVGYTPGYLGTYIYAGTVVYGTGYYYRPWYRTYYYPRHLTWGFHVNYDSYYGWSFGIGLYGYSSNLWYSYGFGWWGPVHHHHHYYSSVTINVDRRTIIKRPGNIYRPVKREAWEQHWREQRQEEKTHRITTDRPKVKNVPPGRDISRDKGVRPSDHRGQQKLDRSRPEPQRNDIFTDKRGDVYRRSNEGWERRDQGNWRPDRSIDKQTDGSTRRQDLNRDLDARERGYERNIQRQRTIPSEINRAPAPSRPYVTPRQNSGQGILNRQPQQQNPSGSNGQGPPLTLPDKKSKKLWE